MTPRWRDVPGETTAEQAVRVAGALAECGVPEVVLNSDGREQRLAARETDLPGVLAGAQVGSMLDVQAAGVRVEVGRDGIRWCATDEALAVPFARAMG